MTTIVVVRHGETTWNQTQRLQGWAPAPLTDLGQEQVSQLGTTLTEEYSIDRILSSDLYRTEETVEILLEHIDAPVTFESAWRERDMGLYQGLPVTQMSKRFPQYDLEEAGPEAAHRRPESGESLVDVRKRVLERWETTLTECEPGETILIVTHGGPIRLLLGHLKNLDIVKTIMEQSQGNCAINEFKVDCKTDTIRIVCENDTGHC
ncbi:histidine phosphatase family protein [Natronolimnobius sp. AArcel1]|uniref:histidine phosphatase family protein n=1 Tax=Natronolimnobius sp. AArcel1 TaxID=1679093 RepID=UPI0013EC90F2|nr:histidine phosphatase family protein [Natronolimnobius sp. AArcel1]NGM71334.1 histidine phosphatase family protein [Natronolimnobius sp. AArcel1]